MSLRTQAIQTALNGDWENAITLNKSLIKQDPGDIDALNRLALAFTITGKLKEAKSSYQKVIKLDPLNSIALKNLKRLKDKNLKVNNNSANYQINNKFLEEPGRTKVVELVNIAPARQTESLRTGQSINLSIKRLKIFVLDGKQYTGVLPDDIGKRLIKFLKGGCTYEAYVKSANPHKVTIFIKEIKKSSKFRSVPSFLSSSDSGLVLDKVKKTRNSAEADFPGVQDDESGEDLL